MRLTSLRLLLLGFVFASLHAAEPGTPEALIERLYQVEMESGAVFQVAENATVAKKFLTQELVSLLVKDAKKSQEGEGVIDFSPIFDAQDWELTDFRVSKVMEQENKSVVKASFANSGQRTVITYDCVATQAGWRVANIRYADGRSLLKLLRQE